MADKPKTIRNEQLKEFITILSAICKKYRAVNDPKYTIYGKAINSIITLGTTEFKKRMKNGEKVPYFGPKLTALYNEFVKTGTIDYDRIDNATKQFTQDKMKSLRKRVSMLNKTLKEVEQQNKPRVAKKLNNEILSLKDDLKQLKKQLTNMSEKETNQLDISDNTLINFDDLIKILTLSNCEKK